MALLYAYQGLPAQQCIRLLRLLPSLDAAKPLEGHLFEYSLWDMYDQMVPYDALSYVWGDPNASHSIQIDGLAFPITASLNTALSYLRHSRRERIIWVDALCIDQNNEREKEHQISLMYQIYACSSCVVVWLGEERDGSDQAIKELYSLGTAAPTNGVLKNTASDYVMRLFQRAWFRRIWVLQEVGAARRIQIQCGNSQMDGCAFAIAINLLHQLPETTDGNETLQNTIRSIAYLIKGSIFRLPYKGPGAAAEGVCTFGELVDMFHDRQATIPHDKIFALLNMSSNDMSKSGLLPDYTIPIGELFQRLVRCIISPTLTVHSQNHQQVAVVKSRGYILGTIDKVMGDILENNTQRVSVKWNYDVIKWLEGVSSWDIETGIPWTIRASTTPIRKTDLVCLLDGALAPTIIRHHHDFAVIIIAAAPFPFNTEFSETIKISMSGWSQTSFPEHEFLLIWDWNYSPAAYSHWETCAVWARAHNWVFPKSMAVTNEDLYGTSAQHWASALICLDGHGMYRAAESFRGTFRIMKEILGQCGSDATLESHFQALLLRDHPLSTDEFLSILLYHAVESRCECLADLLVGQERFDLYDQSVGQRSILALASEAGFLKVVTWLIEKEQRCTFPRPNHIMHHKDSPEAQMHIARCVVEAAGAGHLAIVHQLLQKNTRDMESGIIREAEISLLYTSALFAASKAGHVAVIKRILQEGRYIDEALALPELASGKITALVEEQHFK
ncbi:hypothetical protein PFICI_13292 [Pestalotiopsis fici W106-1]|uniref:Heterokaryon incompatibility domain-containing protein n=1 Tax=Pestalotiopsis fici (strain W106-1 / CGMCC3.15140) TaxID=1229662 RepID=W3WLS3_PESFW|nr:uncharacterized protein PFICI_13292 [Pestalotiopsis fici W106-1]ETS74808.1 hypothetical protein PFICI_13292 [Pestalotiopsis fici W106-1]